MTKKKTTQEFKNEVEKIYKGSVTVLGEYTGNKNKILVRFNECGHEEERLPTKLLLGRGCLKCVNKLLFSIHKNEYRLCKQRSHHASKKSRTEREDRCRVHAFRQCYAVTRAEIVRDGRGGTRREAGKQSGEKRDERCGRANCAERARVGGIFTDDDVIGNRVKLLD